MERRLGLAVVVNGERKYKESSEKNKLPSEKKRLIPRLKTVKQQRERQWNGVQIIIILAYRIHLLTAFSERKDIYANSSDHA